MRLEESKCLAANGFYDGAFYLAGYSIELALKAKICERYNIPNLFSENISVTSDSFKGLSDLRKFLKTHNVNLLLVLVGLNVKFDTDKATNKELANANSLLLNCWDENARYKPCGHKDPKDVQKLITLLSSNNGLLQWILNN